MYCAACPFKSIQFNVLWWCSLSCAIIHNSLNLQTVLKLKVKTESLSTWCTRSNHGLSFRLSWGAYHMLERCSMFGFSPETLRACCSANPEPRQGQMKGEEEGERRKQPAWCWAGVCHVDGFASPRCLPLCPQVLFVSCCFCKVEGKSKVSLPTLASK